MEAVKNYLFPDDLTLQKPYTPSKKKKNCQNYQQICKVVGYKNQYTKINCFYALIMNYWREE